MLSKMKHNIYNTTTDANNFQDKIAAVLKSRDFLQPKVNPCLFLRKYFTVYVYTNECICFSRTPVLAQNLIVDNKDEGYLIKY